MRNTICLVGFWAVWIHVTAAATVAMSCDSNGYVYTECSVPGIPPGGVILSATVTTKYSSSSCIYFDGPAPMLGAGNPGLYGFYDAVLWVDSGCRADFEVTTSECSTDATCVVATPCCDPFSLVCVECCDNADCASDPQGQHICDVINHVCIECLTDEDCDVPQPRCIAGVNVCDEECNSTDTSYCAPNEICDSANGQCVCSNDNDPCNDPNEFCDAAGNCVCDSGYHRNEDGDCVQECTIDGDCQDNEVCTTNGQCVCPADSDPCNDENESCTPDGRCACDPGFIADRDGNCVRDCDPPCAEGRVCTRTLTCVCEPGTVENMQGECVTCVPECQEHGDCRNEGEVCNDDNLCECSPGERLFRGICRENGKLGGFCANGKCYGNGLVCDIATNTCICRKGCGAQSICLRGKPERRPDWRGLWMGNMHSG